MGIVVDGPVLEDIDVFNKMDILNAVIANIIASGGAPGPSIQQSGAFGEAVALEDQLAGKVGPMIGKWDPEKTSRLIQEF